MTRIYDRDQKENQCCQEKHRSNGSLAPCLRYNDQQHHEKCASSEGTILDPTGIQFQSERKGNAESATANPTSLIPPELSVLDSSFQESTSTLNGDASRIPGKYTPSNYGKSSVSLFESASGKKISFSDKNMVQADKMITGIDTYKTPGKSSVSLFESASGKKISFSENNLKQAEKMITGIDTYKTPGKSSVSLFESASGKKISFSDKNMVQADKMITGIDTYKTPGKSSVSLFESASGKKISFSDTNMVQADKMITGIDTYKTPGKSSVSLFESASGKKISFSENNLVQAEKMITGIDTYKTPGKFSVSLFESASGKKISFSDTNMVQAEKMIAGNDDWKTPGKSNVSLFESASGKKISFSENNLVQAEKMITGIDTYKTPGKFSVSLFESASGKKISFSDTNMVQAEKMITGNDDWKTPGKSSVSLFESASGKKMSFSDTNMVQAEKMLTGDPHSILGASISKKQRLSDSHLDQLKPSNVTDNASLTDSNADNASGMIYHSNNSTPGHDSSFSFNMLKKNADSEDLCKNTKNIGRKVTKRHSLGSSVPNTITQKRRRLSQLTRRQSLQAPIQNKLETRTNKVKSKGFKAPKMISAEKRKSIQAGKTKNSFSSISTPAKATSNTTFSANEPPLPEAKVTYRLSDLRNSNSRTSHFVLPHWLLMIDSVSASTVKFNPETSLPSVCGTVGSEQIYEQMVRAKSLPSSDHPECNLAWFKNHFRFIVWKLASMERNFPTELYEKYLTVDQIKLQIFKRYRTEFEKVKRSILKRILQGDSSPAELLVLCISRIPPQKGSEQTVEMTDGWYGIEVKLDQPLSSFVAQGKLKVGSKVLISGSQLTGCESGGVEPMDCIVNNPESSAALRPQLSIHANGTRICSRRLSLGRLWNPVKPIIFSIPLKSIEPQGGMIPSVEVVVQRVYPIGYFDSELKRVLSASEEEQECMRFAKKYEEAMRRYEINRSGPEPEIEPRKVTPIMSCRVTCAKEPSGGMCYNLSIWRPAEDCCRMITEGKCFRVYQVLPSAKDKLSTSRGSRWDACNESEKQSSFIPRSYSSITDMTKAEEERQNGALNSSSLSCEMDTVVYILRISKRYSRGPRDWTQHLFVTDSSFTNLMSIEVHSTQPLYRKYKTGSIMCFMNLEVCYFDTKFELLAAKASEKSLATNSVNRGRPHLARPWEVMTTSLPTAFTRISKLHNCIDVIMGISKASVTESIKNVPQHSVKEENLFIEGNIVQCIRTSTPNFSLLIVDNSVTFAPVLLPNGMLSDIAALFSTEGATADNNLFATLVAKPIQEWLSIPKLCFALSYFQSSEKSAAPSKLAVKSFKPCCTMAK